MVKKASLLTFVAPDQFELLSGEGELADYQFRSRSIHHLFCKSCGIHSFARGTDPRGNEMRAINVRCLDDVDPATVKRAPFDGREALTVCVRSSTSTLRRACPRRAML